MKITGLSSIFTLQNIKSYFSDACNSSGIAKAKALGCILIGCKILKSSKIIFNAYMYPKGWDLSDEEKEALKINDLIHLKLPIETLSLGKPDTYQTNRIKKHRAYIKETLNRLSGGNYVIATCPSMTVRVIPIINKDPNISRYDNEKTQKALLGLQKLYDRTAQLLRWPNYIKSLW